MEKKTIKDPEVFNLTRHRDQQFKRGAAFLLLLGEETQVKLLKQMTTEEREGVLEEIALLDEISPGEARKLQEEFGFISPELPPSLKGGTTKAEELRKKSAG